MLGKSKLHLGSEEGCVVEVRHNTLDGQGITHLYHGATLFGLEELDPHNIAIQTEQIEYPGIRILIYFRALSNMILKTLDILNIKST